MKILIIIIIQLIIISCNNDYTYDIPKSHWDLAGPMHIKPKISEEVIKENKEYEKLIFQLQNNREYLNNIAIKFLIKRPNSRIMPTLTDNKQIETEIELLKLEIQNNESIIKQNPNNINLIEETKFKKIVLKSFEEQLNSILINENKIKNERIEYHKIINSLKMGQKIDGKIILRYLEI